MTDINTLLILPRLRVQGANAVSGPLTWGFPSPTAFTGFAHALERRLVERLPAGFDGIGIVCHHFDPQISKPPGSFTGVFCLTRNPVGENGGTAALVEEGRAHLEVSLLIGIKDWLDDDEREDLSSTIMQVVMSMRLAGGSILPQRLGARYIVRLETWPSDDVGRREKFQKLRRHLLPGFALTLREDRLLQALVALRLLQSEATALDALLDLSRLNIEPASEPDATGEVEWFVRKHEGWLVPLPVGYAGLSDLYDPGQVRNSRDDTTPFRFVESLYSVGEWVSPHRLECLEQLLWYTQADTGKGIYRCINRYTDFLTDAIDGIV